MAHTTISGKTNDFLNLKAPRNLAIYTRNKGISDFGSMIYTKKVIQCLLY